MTARILLNAIVLVPGFVSAIGLAAGAGVPSEQTSNAGASVVTTSVATPMKPTSIQQLSVYSAEGVGINAAEQVTSVSQLSDVKPTDWAF